MARREKFGRLVLLREREPSPLGVEYIAARLGPEGLDRLVSVLRYAPEVSEHVQAVSRLTEQARVVARLRNPGLLRLIGVGRVGSHSYVSHELVEGRSLQAVVERSRQEGVSFSAENALMVASRAAAALEYVHGRKDDGGRPFFHGLLHPRHIVVSYDGDVRIDGLGVWPSLGSTGLLGADARRCLAPEQAAGGSGDCRSDVRALGLVLLEALTLDVPAPSDPGATLAEGSMFGPGGERQPLPESLVELLRRALASDPGERFPDMAEMRRAIDAILFSGDSPSTTFNLAFFMHTVFRDEVERESRELEEARRADYTAFLVPARSLPPAPEAAATRREVSSPEGLEGGALVAPSSTADAAVVVVGPTDTVLAPPSTASAPARAPEDAPVATEAPTARPEARRTAPPVASGAFSPIELRPGDSSGANLSLRSRARRAAATRAAASQLVLSRPTGPHLGRRRLLALVVGLIAVVAGGGGAGYVYLLQHGRATSTSPATTLGPQAAAALARVHELEARIAELERQNAEAEQEPESATDPAGPPAPPVGRSEDDTARQARHEGRREAGPGTERRQAEIRRLEEEKRMAEARLVLEPSAVRPAGVAPPANPLPTVAPPPPTPEPPVTTLATVVPGALVDAGDPTVTPPFLLKESRASYPPLARQLNVEGSVLIEALVDEKGRVAETRILQPSGYRVGFEEAAVRQVKGRRYRPATKSGVRVRMWVKVRVNFTL